MYNNVAV